MNVAAWCSAYIGLPFKTHGRTRDGLDCWGLARLIYAEQFGIDLPSLVEVYDDTLVGNAVQIGTEIRARAGTAWVEVAAGSEREGDIVVVIVRGEPMHIGVVVGSQKMVHIEDGLIGCVIADYTGVHFRKKIWGFYRHVDAA